MPIHTNLKYLSLVIVFAIFTMITNGRAATIFWSVFGTVSSSDDVLNTGLLIQAEYAGGSGPLTINGITFQSGFTSYVTADGVSTREDVYNGDTGDAAYNIMLDHFAYDGTDPGVLILNSLSIGSHYQVELWSLDDRGGIDTRTENFDDGAGDFSATITTGNNTIIVGTFIADGTQQIINVNGVGQTAHNLNAFELMAVPEPAPEPSAWMLLAMGTIGLFALRRSKTTV